MHLRRSLALTAGALVLLTSCGFDLATDRPYNPGEGTNDHTGDVEVLSALVVAAQPDAGSVVVTLVNSTDEDQTLTDVTGADLEIGDFDAITVPGQSHVNLADEGGIPVTGDFDAGKFLSLTFTFENGETSTFDVPVVTACGPYEGLDVSEDADGTPYSCDAEHQDTGGEGH